VVVPPLPALLANAAFTHWFLKQGVELAGDVAPVALTVL
jgi:hypothetical protein